MGLFDWFKSGTTKALSPEELLQKLQEAAASNKSADLLKLCKQHEAAILEHFPSWQKVPDAVRADPARVQRYAQGLIGTAQCFAERLGNPSLLKRLQGTPDNNPIEQWKKMMQAARELNQGLQYEEALALVNRHLESVRNLSGTQAKQMLAMTLGIISQCLFELGRSKDAGPFAQEALDICRAVADQEGVVAYTYSLYEIHRYLGNQEQAAAFARQHADANRHSNPALARRYDALATVVQKGEPLNRVVVEIEGELYEQDEGPFESEQVAFNFVRNRLTLSRSSELTHLGEELGSKGQYEEALVAFRRASDADPFNPQPHYLMGLTLQHLNRFSDAVTCYEETEALAPGWFQVRSDLWLARQIVAGALPREAFELLRATEVSTDPEERVRLIRATLARLHNFAPLLLTLGQLLIGLKKSWEALEALEVGLAHAQEPDVRSRLLFARAMLEPPDSVHRAEMLEDAMAPGGSLVAAAMARVALQQRVH